MVQVLHILGLVISFLLLFSGVFFGVIEVEVHLN